MKESKKGVFEALPPGLRGGEPGLAEVGADSEVWRVQFALNHPNPGDPVAGSSIVANANAGRITATLSFPVASSPRTGQFGVQVDILTRVLQ
jgi:hypothetical protein